MDSLSNLVGTQQFIPLPYPPPGVIKNGYGEYLVFRITDQGKKEPITEDEYEQIYDLIEEERALIPEDRHSDLKAKIQAKLGTDISIAFFPHGMYEETYLTQCFEEEREKGHSSHALATGIMIGAFNPKYTSEERSQDIQESLKTHFWQQCLFDDQDYANGFQPKDKLDYRYQHVKRIAGRLNQKILGKYAKYCSDKEGFTFEEFQKVHSELLENFKNLYSYPIRKIDLGFSNCPSITTQCSQEISEVRGKDFFPQGVLTQKHINILQRALQLECSAKAVNHLVLYKGSNFSLDALMRKQVEFIKNSPLLPTSVHYPISFFSIYDAQAAAFHHMRKPDLDAHAVCVSLKKQQTGQTPFHIYNVHPLLQLMSKGEFFFPRTKLWELQPGTKVLGFFGIALTSPISNLPSGMQFNMTYEELNEKYQKYRNKTYLLAAGDKTFFSAAIAKKRT